MPATVELEKQGLPLSRSLEIILHIQNSLISLNDKGFSQKLESVLTKNPGFKIAVDIDKVINQRLQPSEQFVSKLSSYELTLFKYCPTSSADVERSFSAYKNVLADNRRSFLFDNLKQHVIVLCNRQNK